MASSGTAEHKFCDVPTVKLLVGPDKAAFTVHRNQLCEASPFFKAAFMSEFKEGAEQEMELPEDDVTIVDLFVQWIYTGQCRFSTRFELLLRLPTLAMDDEEECFHEPIRLYIFSDRYSVPALRKHVLERLLTYAKNTGFNFRPPKSIVEYVYENTCQGSGLRRFIVNWHAWCADPEHLSESAAEVLFLKVPEFTMDLLIAILKFSMKLRDPEHPFMLDGPEQYLK
ncbi:hypothetical protein ACLMJK_007004 [Lecanora helva]